MLVAQCTCKAIENFAPRDEIRRFLWDKMAILISIGLKIGLHITLDRDDGQNKLEGCISKNMTEMAQN